MEILNLVQGSDEWLIARLNYLCASECPAMMGDSKFMSRNQLLDLKKGWQTNPVDDFKKRLFEKGHESEEAARELLEIDLCEDIPAAVGLEIVDDLELLASFDGYNYDTLIFEHKDWNLILAENARNGILDPLYYWQLEHQALVAGLNEVLFMVSDGTLDNRVSFTYTSVPERREAIIAGWKQFVADLAEHQLEAKQELITAREIKALPSINYKVEGSVIVSNIADCLPAIKDRAQIEMDRKLETEQDFIDKAAFNKATKDAREKLKGVVSAVQGEFVSYSEFADTAAEIDAVLQKMQSAGEKQVKDQKAAKKKEIADHASLKLGKFIQECDESIAPLTIYKLVTFQADFDGAMKGKRNVDVWKDVVDEELARVKIIINQAMDRIVPNLTYLRENAEEYKFLFSDTNAIINQDAEPFQAIVRQRIADHKAETERELEAERERIRLEEEVKAQASVAQEAPPVVNPQTNPVAEQHPQRIVPGFIEASVTEVISSQKELDQLCGIFGKQALGKLACDENGNLYELEITVTRKSVMTQAA